MMYREEELAQMVEVIKGITDDVFSANHAV